jgi:hypothetical protein
MPPKVIDTSSEVGVGEQKALGKRATDQEIADMNYMLADPRGRRFLYRYIYFAGHEKTSFTGNNSETFFLEGQRNIANKMLDDIKRASFKMYLLMLEEGEHDD